MSESVTVSIVIVTYNGLEFTRRCVASLLEHTKGVPFEIIFVDNNSTDGTPEYIREVPQARVVANAENRGFAAACNQGLDLARGDYIVLLNPDTVVTEGWLERLIAHAKRPGVGAVGPRSNQTGELQHDLAAQGQFEALDQMHAYARRVAAEYRGRYLEFHRLAGFCVLVNREAMEAVGHLDEQFGIGFYEDDDYSTRMRKAGFRLLIALDVFIYHEGGTSFSALTPGWTNQLMLINRMRYLTKWSGRKWFTEMPAVDLHSPAVSVLTPTRDRPRLLRHAVASVLAQTFQNFEIIVVDDGEEDVAPTLEEFADERVRLMRSGGRGKSAALNVGLEVACGQFIAYLDDDDMYYPWHLQTLVCALSNRPTYRLAYTDTVVGYCFPSGDGHRVVTSHPFPRSEYDRARLREGNFIPNLAVMHHRSLLDEAGPYDEGLPLHEDWDRLRWFTCFTDFLHVPLITSEWHRHPAVTSLNQPPLESVDLKERADRYIMSKPLPEMVRPTVHDLVTIARNEEAIGLFKVAADRYLSALRIDPLSFEAGLGAARVLAMLGWHSRVMPILRQCIASRPDIPEAYIAYAQGILGKGAPRGDVLEAKEALEMALVAEPAERREVVYRLLGDCYRRLGQRDTARACQEYSQRLQSLGLLGRFLRAWRREGLVVALGRTIRMVYMAARGR